MDRYKVTKKCNGFPAYSRTFYYKEQALKEMKEWEPVVKFYGGSMTLEEIQWNVIDFFVSNS